MGNRPPQAWPVLSDAALVGLAGDIVRTLLPHTEADQAALLVTFLTMFGSCVGPGPYMMVGSVRHEARLFTVICGATARARKGQSFHDIRQFFKLADSLWLQRASISGLSSGEGVIEAMKAAGDIGTFIIEEEFARALTAARRQTSTLSPVLREAFDSNSLRVATRHNPVRVDHCHASMLAHITTEELAEKMPTLEVMNGFGNRFLFAVAKRSKVLPNGGCPNEKDLRSLGDRLASVITAARTITQIQRSKEADAAWAPIYTGLEEHRGLLGAATARGPALMVRAQLIFALLDGTSIIEPKHVLASAALWDYCYDSAAMLFGADLDDPKKEKLYKALLQAYPDGLNGTKIAAIFHGNLKAGELERLRGELQSEGKAQVASLRNDEHRGAPELLTYAIVLEGIDSSNSLDSSAHSIDFERDENGSTLNRRDGNEGNDAAGRLGVGAYRDADARIYELNAPDDLLDYARRKIPPLACAECGCSEWEWDEAVGLQKCSGCKKFYVPPRAGAKQ